MRIMAWLLLLIVLSVPFLIGAAAYGWFRTRRELPRWQSFMGISGAGLAILSWSFFIVGVFRGWIGGFGSHSVTSLRASNFGLMVSMVSMVSFVCVLFLRSRSRICGIASTGIVFFLWAGSQLVA